MTLPCELTLVIRRLGAVTIIAVAACIGAVFYQRLHPTLNYTAQPSKPETYQREPLQNAIPYSNPDPDWHLRMFGGDGSGSGSGDSGHAPGIAHGTGIAVTGPSSLVYRWRRVTLPIIPPVTTTPSTTLVD